MAHTPQSLHPTWRTWHITWGTRGGRLHGGERPTVDDQHNQRGQSFIESNAARYTFERNNMNGEPVVLTPEQQHFIQQIIPSLCERGGWSLRTCSAGADHVHVLLDAERAVDGETIRRILKRWLTQALEKHWPTPACGGWWARQGSNKPVMTEKYLNRAFPYVHDQRAV